MKPRPVNWQREMVLADLETMRDVLIAKGN